jgi:hypothetical protein
MQPHEIIGQALSVIGMILTILSFQFKTKKQILLMQTAGSTFFLISYVLLGSFAAVYLNVVFLARNMVFYFKEDKKWAQHKVWLFLLLAAVVAAGCLGFRTAWDIVPIVGALFGTVAAYMRNENMFRLFKLGDSPCWLLYNASIPSIGGAVCEVFNIISITVGLIRYRKNGFGLEKNKK